MMAGVVMSLIFRYVPGMRDAFDQLDATQKQAFMGMIIICVGLASAALGCAGWFNLVTCEREGFETTVRSIIIALMANQTAYSITRRKKQ
jgi:uncharacterized membrane protein YidH (DUF202 family)